MLKFLNFYLCPRCDCRWMDKWSAQCDDDCPNCGFRHISPHKSEDAPVDPQDVLRDIADTFRRINGSCANLSAEDKLAMFLDHEDAVFEVVGENA